AHAEAGTGAQCAERDGRDAEQCREQRAEEQREGERRHDRPNLERRRDLDPSSRADVTSRRRLLPGLRLVEHADVAADLERALLGPDFGLVHLPVLRVGDGAALVAVTAGAQILDDDQADDRLVLVRPRTLRADLGLALRVVGLREADDLAEYL